MPTITITVVGRTFEVSDRPTKVQQINSNPTEWEVVTFRNDTRRNIIVEFHTPPRGRQRARATPLPVGAGSDERCEIHHKACGRHMYEVYEDTSVVDILPTDGDIELVAQPPLRPKGK